MPSTRRRPSNRLRVALAVLVLLGGVAFVLLSQRDGGLSGGGSGGGEDAAAPLPAREPAPAPRADEDPFAYDAARMEEYAQRAAFGTSHPLYVQSPGGAVETAERVAALRPLIEEAAASGDVDPDTLEAMVFIESAGRPTVRAGNDLAGAVGLTQILAETGTSMLGMRVDVRRSTQLTRAIQRAENRGQRARAQRLAAERRRVDERYDPRKALAGTVRYLGIAKEHLGRDDLAVVSYHMGIGNLQNAIDAAGELSERPPGYTELFFGSSPTRNPRAWEILAGLGDDSALYYWRVQAARDVMRRYREEPETLQRIAQLQTQKASHENVLHAPDAGEAFEDAGALRDAYANGELTRLPRNARQLGLRIDPQMGELAPRLRQPKALYRGLRPEALTLLVELAAGVRRISGSDAPLTITSTVRDQDYQERLASGNIEATRAFSVHTTGWSFDILRRYANGRQAQALQFMLDRLQALGLIAWVREPAAIHVTVAGDVDRFVTTTR